jgi:hypothetical protein
MDDVKTLLNDPHNYGSDKKGLIDSRIKKMAQDAVSEQFDVSLNAVKEASMTSQVDEAIKRATAQLKSFSNFDGLKPYKPKKK